MRIWRERAYMSSGKLQKPFLKWVGGKTQIIGAVVDKVPREMNNYHEPFLGGGSVLLAVLSLRKRNEIVIKGDVHAYDVNANLIDVYAHVQKDKDALFVYISRYVQEYDSIDGNAVFRKPSNVDEAKTSKESYYYWVRAKYNEMDRGPVERSAMFMFLNKMCFRGIYREGPNGFNVPYGHYKKTPIVITKEELDSVSELIQEVHFIQSDFRDSIKNPKEGDYVYLDPPYAPENRKSFVGYTRHGFTLEDHISLFKGVVALSKTNVRFAMSNAKVDLVTDYFKDYQREEIVARRAIHSKNPGSTTTEVIIYN